MDMQPIEPRPFSATMTPEQWNVVLFVLRRYAMPFEISAPIINALSAQFGRQAQAQRPLSTEDMAARAEPEA